MYECFSCLWMLASFNFPKDAAFSELLIDSQSACLLDPLSDYSTIFFVPFNYVRLHSVTNHFYNPFFGTIGNPVSSHFLQFLSYFIDSFHRYTMRF